MAISVVVIIVSIFNFVFTYSVAKTVLEHTKVISLLAKNRRGVDRILFGFKRNY